MSEPEKPVPAPVPTAVPRMMVDVKDLTDEERINLATATERDRDAAILQDLANSKMEIARLNRVILERSVLFRMLAKKCAELEAKLEPAKPNLRLPEEA